MDLEKIIISEITNLAQSLAVDLCICFHQLLDDDSIMTIKVVINLITGEGQLWHLLQFCLDSELGSSL